MPSVKELKNVKTKLKKVPKSSGNTPKIQTAELLRLIAADPKIRRDREFLKRLHELMKK